MVTKYIKFHNKTDLPIMIDSWIDGSNELKCLKINAGEKLVIHSSVGEWHINSMFDDYDDWNKWKKHGLENYVNLGKFRSDPCAMNNYSWMEWPDIFNCVYNECEPGYDNNIIGLITFTYSKKL